MILIRKDGETGWVLQVWNRLVFVVGSELAVSGGGQKLTSSSCGRQQIEPFTIGDADEGFHHLMPNCQIGE